MVRGSTEKIEGATQIELITKGLLKKEFVRG